MKTNAYVAAMQLHFSKHANADIAAKMSKYMLNQFEYFGIPSPLRKQLLSSFIAENGLPAPAQLNDVVRMIWLLPQRELHYAIMEICSRKPFLADDNKDKLYRFMITTKSWWDTVDYIASNLVGAWLLRHKNLTGPVITEFVHSDNMWLQRTALLFQLKYRQSTDFNLLCGFIAELSDSKEFFIRKAIGWALREYSKTNPEAVYEFVAGHQLSPLSKKEALRIILKKTEK